MQATDIAQSSCGRCRDRRVKCDRRKPGCRRCEKYAQQCPGYERRRVFRDQGPSLHKRFSRNDSGYRETSSQTSSATTLPPAVDPPTAGASDTNVITDASPEVASTGVLQDSISDDDRFFDLDPAVYYEQEGKLCGVDFSASHPPPDIQPVTPCEVEVPSSTDPEEVLTPDLSPAVTRENTLYALLVRRFVEVISPWLDVFDPDRYFGYVVPIRASRSSLLRDSLAAVAAKQLGNLGCHTETQCNTDSSTAPEPLDPTVALSVDWSFEAASFYDRAIRSMINALQSIASPIHIETRLGSPPDRREAIDDLLSAMPILLVYELMDNRHLSMVQHLAGARHLLGFVLQQHEARTPGDAAYAPSLEQSVQKAWKASFWNFVCFDYVISYAGRSKPSIGFPDARLWHQSGLSLTEVDGQFVPASLVGDIHSSSPKMTETIACRTLLWIILRILDCVVSDGQVSEGQQANGRVHQRCRTTCHQGMGTAPWEQVDEYLRNWYMALPDTFEPCLRAPQPFPALASSSIRAPLQGFFIANPMGATALPLYHFSRILFLLHSHVTDEAFNSATGSRRIKIYRQFSRQVNHHAVEICSAAAGQPPPAAQMHLIQRFYFLIHRYRCQLGAKLPLSTGLTGESLDWVVRVRGLVVKVD
ncbi:hypothetical protein V3481_010981 [Fusarium oxysporum f. sp. vasinfectum]|uniref:Zn(2)-C6 fungal-type domain-containing protein n=1 Tax=Fusarium oxysporum f. sp. vasinfectum 25433 TaxID=1089449 RepID=X0MLR7_FUSOX|nr:hypothetical protein FOTG_01199 [Fusarium oxysporum f. sp. vasinfectum 25433]